MVNSFKTATGADVVINPADWENAMELKNAIASAFKRAGIKIDLAKLRSDMDLDINTFIAALLEVDTSKEVYDALFKCLPRCTYNGIKITSELFDDKVKAREDYYEIYIACVKENITPFFKGLISRLNGIKSQILSSIQK